MLAIAAVATVAALAVADPGVPAAPAAPADARAAAMAATAAAAAAGAQEPTSDDRAAAATTSGVGAFVGVTLGGVVVPGVAGLIGNFIQARPSSSDLLLLATVGGAGGAFVGGALGAVPTTDPWIGEGAVAVAAAVGALAGLLPAQYFATQTPATKDPNDPVKLQQSACVLVSVVASSGAAAAAGAWLAAPKVHEVKKAASSTTTAISEPGSDATNAMPLSSSPSDAR